MNHRVLNLLALVVVQLLHGCGSGPVDPPPDAMVMLDGGRPTDAAPADLGPMPDLAVDAAMDTGILDDGGVDAGPLDDGGVDAGPLDDGGVDAGAPLDAGAELDLGVDAGLGALGASCATAAECGSAFCADGVCCNAACDGLCEQCGSGGACRPLAASVECRASAGVCDVAELCNGTDGLCPGDQLIAGGNVCAPFRCTGASPACPTSCDDQSACASGKTCVGGACVDARIVFLTSTTTTGDLGGVAGADAFCQAHGDAANLGRTFRAWVSLTSSSAASRLTPATVPYVMLVAGQPATGVANNWADLTDGTLAAPISRTETGGPASSSYAWTNTFAAGNAPHDAVSCMGWTSGSASDAGIVGLSTATNSSWAFALNRTCDTAYALYCVEQ